MWEKLSTSNQIDNKLTKWEQKEKDKNLLKKWADNNKKFKEVKWVIWYIEELEKKFGDLPDDKIISISKNPKIFASFKRIVERKIQFNMLNSGSLERVINRLAKQSIQNIENNVDMFIEFGGNVLKGLNKKSTSKPTICINDTISLEKAFGEI